MRGYLLRVEGQNLGAFIADTQDLSTMRGGSLALLDAIRSVAGIAGAKLHPVTTGASIGVWRFEADDAAATVAAVRKALASHPVHRHATFHVAAAPETGSYLADAEVLRAQARRGQMASAGLVYPAEEGAVCPVDLVRPVSDRKQYVGIERKLISAAVFDRRKFGREEKQTFYAKLPGVEAPRGDYAFQMNSISESAAPPPLLRANLRDKIAVLYMDGNGFGKMQDAFIESGDVAGGATQQERQETFDKRVQGNRKDLLKALLDLVEAEKGIGPPSDEENKVREDARRPAKTVVRFETLLWGGDEMMFALPARLGWQAAELIVKLTSAWRLGGKPMHHGIGLVFCHHDAPVARVTQLARHLADHAKDLEVAPSCKVPAACVFKGRDVTLVMPMALESFDHIGKDIDLFLVRRARPELKVEARKPRSGKPDAVQQARLDAEAVQRNASFVLEAREVALLRTTALAVRAKLSRRRLKALARAIHFPRTGLLEKARADLGKGRALDAFDVLIATMGMERACLFLDEYWDYLLPEKAKTAQGDAA